MVAGDPNAPVRMGCIRKFSMRSGKMETLYTECDGHPLIGPNDIVFAPNGDFWFTDLGKEGDGIIRIGGLYYAKADGSGIRCVAHGPRLNGVGLSPDGKAVYAGSTYTRQILGFSGDPTAEVPRGVGWTGRIVTDFRGKTLPDSLAIEAGGVIAQAVVV